MLRKKCLSKRKIISSLFLIIFMAQIYILNSAGYAYKESINNINNFKKVKVDYSTTLITDTIRHQQRYMLNSLRQSWIQYIDQNNINNLVYYNNDKPIFANTLTQIEFDKDNMYKVQKADNFFDIYSNNNILLASNVRPQWNVEQAIKILQILAAPIKPFGNNGGVVIYDSYSGEVFLDTSKINRTSNEKYRNIFQDNENQNNKNPIETKKVIDKEFVFRKDSDRTSAVVYMFNEPMEMGDYANDFEKYPLGKYNRLFIEKIVLPYETIGVGGHPMQLTALLIVDESDAIKEYENVLCKFDNAIDENVSIFNSTSKVVILSIILSMIIILLSMYIINQNIKQDDKGEVPFKK